DAVLHGVPSRMGAPEVYGGSVQECLGDVTGGQRQEGRSPRGTAPALAHHRQTSRSAPVVGRVEGSSMMFWLGKTNRDAHDALATSKSHLRKAEHVKKEATLLARA